MDAIRGIFILAAIAATVWAASAYFEAVGGWPGMIATLVGISVIGFWWNVRQQHRSEIRDLKVIPGRVQTQAVSARENFEAAIHALNAAELEFEENRGPFFWDRINECSHAISKCISSLKAAKAMTDDYNRRAPGYNLNEPERIAPFTPAAFDDTAALVDAMTALFEHALTVPSFAMIYEQRRQTDRILDAQKALRSDIDDLAAVTRQAASAATDAARSARSAHTAADSARRAGKDARASVRRATGEWF